MPLLSSSYHNQTEAGELVISDDKKHIVVRNRILS